jgi:signal transduction histidine kinase
MPSPLVGLNRQRLRLGLLAFFLALAVPSAVLVYQAFGRLAWEAFHQQQVLAEELARRIDARLAAMVDAESGRGFADYGFLVVEGDPEAGYLQRSPLSAYPPRTDVPGLIGYFQVDAQGVFSSPLLPRGTIDPGTYGLTAAEVTERTLAEQRLEQMLGSNRLVDRQRAADARQGAVLHPPGLEASALGQTSSPPAAERPAHAPAPTQAEVWAGQERGRAKTQRLSRRELTVLPDAEPSPDSAAIPSQAPATRPAVPAPVTKLAPVPLAAASAETVDGGSRDLGKMSDMKGEPVPRSQRVRIRTFESEIDPFEVSRLASGQIVLHRRVWRVGQRYTQGVLIDPAAFLDGAVGGPFREAALARACDLSVTWQDQPLAAFPGQPGRDYGAQVAQGTALYHTRLSAPWNDLGLAFFVTRLPLGPGAEVIAWVGAALTLVLCGGVFALYRLGVRQIDLVHQQRDFVSAVSHELKTPLTSIRMYSEMLREGWVPEDKRRGYYQFIHDESERLSRLINNVLQLARMTRNEHGLELRPTSCAELMDLARTKVSGRIEAAGFALRLICAPQAGETRVRVDPDAFAQVVINLVDNAVKFSAKAQLKEVEIGCERLRGGAVLFRVRDYGPGVPPNQMKKVFGLFYRAEGALTRETLGTGIGLALVQGLTQAMGGTVDLVNRDPGAELRLTLPGLGPLARSPEGLPPAL